MQTQQDRALAFAGLHIPGDPVIIFNIWDAGSAAAVGSAGAKALGTGSWSVAAANGYADGEHLPLDTALANIRRIVETVDLPVTLDFEGGYAADTSSLSRNVSAALDTGIVGINFEDQVIGGDGLYSIDQQSNRIRAVREVADENEIALFINARTDVFLKTDPDGHAGELDEALRRADAYARAGASGFFAPGLKDPEIIRSLCADSPVPVNIMVMSDTPSNAEMASLGVARISYGPGPYRGIIEALKTAARTVFSDDENGG